MAISRTDIAPSTTEQAGLAQINTDLNTAYDAINANEGVLTSFVATVAGVEDAIEGSQWYLAQGVKAYPGSTPATHVGVEAAALALKNQAGTEWVIVYGLSGASALEADITASGANGLDAGAEAVSTWYHVWVAAKDGGADPISLISTSDTWPAMPATYTYGRRVHSVRNDSAGDLIPSYKDPGSQDVWYDYGDTDWVVGVSDDLVLLDGVPPAAWPNSDESIATDDYAPSTAQSISLEFFSNITADGGTCATRFWFKPYGASGYRTVAAFYLPNTTVWYQSGDFVLKIDAATRDIVWQVSSTVNAGAASSKFFLRAAGYRDYI